MSLTAIIQARMASSRLPGKAALPLDGVPVIRHNIRRAFASSLVDEVVLATTFHSRDDLLVDYATAEGADVFRGSEDDVLGRLYEASKLADSETIVRLTGDNPLIAPDLIDTVGHFAVREDVDYVSNKLDRTFPLGVDAEALTVESLQWIHERTRDPYHREHATKYFRECSNDFELRNVTVADVYDEQPSGFGPDVRLTLDEVADYKLFRTLYDELEYDEIVDVREAVRYILDNGLEGMNAHVDQKTL